MMRSMYSGVSGLRVHQTKMDVISNNIANINTIGFKRSTATFKDSFSQTLSAASAATEGTGGINPQQIGLGASVGAISTIMDQGAAQRTDYGSDLMINGDGFFIVQDATGYYFTRAGVFEIDAAGNLVNSSGLKVCGWQAIEDPDNPGQQKIVQDQVTPINIYGGDNIYTSASATTAIEFTGNFNSTTSPEQKNTVSFYDSQGNLYTIDVQFTKMDTNEWEVSIPSEDGEISLLVNGETMTMPESAVSLGGNTTLKFATDGTIDTEQGTFFTIEGFDNTQITTLDGENAGLGGSVNEAINVDYSSVTQFNSSATVSSNKLDGNTAGSMTGYSIDSNGIIRGVYSNGDTKVLAQIPLANFANPAGLEKVGDSLFAATSNSGDFDGIGSDVSSLGSSIQSGALEMSNVDLSYEFTEMIVTQRGFQANSRIISASDEMLQTLVNLI